MPPLPPHDSRSPGRTRDRCRTPLRALTRARSRDRRRTPLRARRRPAPRARPEVVVVLAVDAAGADGARVCSSALLGQPRLQPLQVRRQIWQLPLRPLAPHDLRRGTPRACSSTTALLPCSCQQSCVQQKGCCGPACPPACCAAPRATAKCMPGTLTSRTAAQEASPTPCKRGG